MHRRSLRKQPHRRARCGGWRKRIGLHLDRCIVQPNQRRRRSNLQNIVIATNGTAFRPRPSRANHTRAVVPCGLHRLRGRARRPRNSTSLAAPRPTWPPSPSAAPPPWCWAVSSTSPHRLYGYRFSPRRQHAFRRTVVQVSRRICPRCSPAPSLYPRRARRRRPISSAPGQYHQRGAGREFHCAYAQCLRWASPCPPAMARTGGNWTLAASNVPFAFNSFVAFTNGAADGDQWQPAKFEQHVRLERLDRRQLCRRDAWNMAFSGYGVPISPAHHRPAYQSINGVIGVCRPSQNAAAAYREGIGAGSTRCVVHCQITSGRLPPPTGRKK